MRKILFGAIALIASIGLIVCDSVSGPNEIGDEADVSEEADVLLDPDEALFLRTEYTNSTMIEFYLIDEAQEDVLVLLLEYGEKTVPTEIDGSFEIVEPFAFVVDEPDPWPVAFYLPEPEQWESLETDGQITTGYVGIGGKADVLFDTDSENEVSITLNIEVAEFEKVGAEDLDIADESYTLTAGYEGSVVAYE